MTPIRIATIGPWLLALVLALGMAIAVPTVGQEATSPFSLPSRDGWRPEAVVLPPAFAPSFRHEGLAELRFSPGMFDPGREDFWSYLMVWWVAEDTALDAAALADDLRVYYQGLVGVVAPGQGFDPASVAIEVTLEADGAEGFDGRATTLDAFATGKAITLSVRVDRVACAASEHVALIFSLTPQGRDHAVWTDLDALRDGFRCAR